MAAVLPMREYTGTEPLKKISKTVAVDSNGQKYRTHSGVKHPGAGEGAGAGQPRTFGSGKEILTLWQEYLREIADNGFQNEKGVTIYPGKGKFAEYCGVDRSTIYKTVERYYPEVKKDWEQALSETLSDGVAAGAYQTAFTIFMMKNLCDWSDKQETKLEQRKVQVATKEEAAEALKEYAASRQKKE